MSLSASALKFSKALFCERQSGEIQFWSKEGLRYLWLGGPENVRRAAANVRKLTLPTTQ